MKTTLTTLISAFALLNLLVLTIFARAADQPSTDIAKRLEASGDVLTQMMSSPETSIPTQIFAEAKCIVVVPSMVKVALGIGGRHGKGVATCRVGNSWSAPGLITISGGSIGLQVGGQADDVVIIAMDQSALIRLLSTKFKIGSEVAGSPGPVGEQSDDSGWRNVQILSYSRSHGVFAGINLKGTAVKQDKDATIDLYGRYVPIASILMGMVRPPEETHAFLAAVRKYTTG